jgi:TRAP-type C4-dicarboxylate transport system substrate-binding protein
MIALGAAAVLLSAGCVAGGDRGPVTLSLADSFSETHVMSEGGVRPFIEALGADSPVGIEYFPGGQLGSGRDLVSLTRTGALDVTNLIPAYVPDLVPLTNVADLPGIEAGSCAASSALMELISPGGILYEEEIAERGLRPLWVTTLTGSEIFTVDEPVRTPEDLRGLTIRSSGGVMDMTIDGLGAAATTIAGTEQYEALSRKTLDGVGLTPANVLTYRLHEVLRYGTEGIHAGSSAVIYAISEDSWRSLTAEQRSALEDAAATAAEDSCRLVEEQAEGASETLRDSDIELLDLDEEEVEAFTSRLEPIKERWAEQLDEAGKPGTEVLRAYEEAVERHSARES